MAAPSEEGVHSHLQTPKAGVHCVALCPPCPLQILKRDRSMDKKVRKAAVKEKKEEIKAIKEQKKGLAQQFKDAKKGMTGIIMTNYLKKKKNQSVKVRQQLPAGGRSFLPLRIRCLKTCMSQQCLLST